MTGKGMERKMGDVVEVYSTIISLNYSRGTEEEHELSRLVEAPTLIEMGGS